MPPLKGLDVELFLREHWQRKPLLLRGALPDFEGFLSIDDIVGLCAGEETPSRFLSSDEEMVHGPFELDLEQLPGEGWTVLVQSLETVSEEAWRLLDVFDFLPRARLDDVMVSYATTGGGIGPHFDLYDVFLVQGTGRRRWRYCDAQLDAAHDADASSHFPFEADHDVELGPGDVLYLPPRVLHDGEAITPCTTYSVGAAAPRHADLVGEFLAFAADEPDEAGLDFDGIYTDAGQSRQRRRGAIPPHLIEETLALLTKLRFEPETVAFFLGRLLTGPKPHTTPPEGARWALDDVTQRLSKAGQLRLSPSTKMLHDGERWVFAHGDAFELEAKSCLLQLADERALALPVSLDEQSVEVVRHWLEAGFVIIEDS